MFHIHPGFITLVPNKVYTLRELKEELQKLRPKRCSPAKIEWHKDIYPGYTIWLLSVRAGQEKKWLTNLRALKHDANEFHQPISPGAQKRVLHLRHTNMQLR